MANWEKGERETSGIMVSGFGEVFVALDRRSNDLVAIKRVKMQMDDGKIASESRLLNDRLDSDGILSMRLGWSVFEEWRTTKGGGAEGGCELLRAWIELSSQ